MVKPSNALLPELEKNEENEQPLALAVQCCEIYHLLINRHVLYLFIFIVTFQTEYPVRHLIDSNAVVSSIVVGRLG